MYFDSLIPLGVVAAAGESARVCLHVRFVGGQHVPASNTKNEFSEQWLQHLLQRCQPVTRDIKLEIKLSESAVIKIALARGALNNELLIEPDNSKKKSFAFCLI